VKKSVIGIATTPNVTDRTNRRARRSDHPFVSIVCSGPDELDNLQLYLGRAGMSSYSTPNIETLDIAAPESAAAIILFPDELEDDKVREFLRRLGQLLSQPLVLVVTRHPEHLGSIIRADERMIPALIFASPCSAAEMILALRTHLGDA
jgi:hypothetical protein